MSSKAHDKIDQVEDLIEHNLERNPHFYDAEEVEQLPEAPQLSVKAEDHSVKLSWEPNATTSIPYAKFNSAEGRFENLFTVPPVLMGSSPMFGTSFAFTVAGTNGYKTSGYTAFTSTKTR